MRKFLIIAIIIIILIVGVSIYSCKTQEGVAKPEQQIGGIYQGQVIAVATNQEQTVIYWGNNQKPTVVMGNWSFQIGASYVITKDY